MVGPPSQIDGDAADMITDAGSESGRLANSGRDRSAKPGQSSFPIHPKQTSSPPEAEKPTDQDGLAVQRHAALAARSAFASLPSIGVPASAPDGLTQAMLRIQGTMQQTLSDQVTPLRLAGHLSVLLIAGVILI